MSDEIETKKTTTWTNGETKVTTVRVTYKDGRVSEYTLRDNAATSIVKLGLAFATGIIIGKKFF